MLEGEPGIGKTSLWEEGVAQARAQGKRVLVCRAAGSEVQLSFAALGDLLSGVLDEKLPSLPSPQRHALEAALLLADDEPQSADQRALATGFLNVVRLCAETGPVLLAIDDAHWLDPPSAGVLEFALRRLETEPVGVLASVRGSGDAPAPLALDRAPLALERVVVGPLSPGALYELLATRLGLELSRPVLIRLHETSGGSPFYALELARTLQRLGVELRPHQPLPLPESLGELLRERLDRLPARARRTLLVASAVSQPTVEVLEAASGDPEATAVDLERAARAGVLDLAGDRISFSHGLFAAATYSGASSRERSAVHRRLAEVVGDVEERARHLALASARPDSEVAATLEQAAAVAVARGAPETGAELAEHAARLTPTATADDKHRRTLAAADYHLRAGADARARQLLEQTVAALPAGATRAAALHQLAWTRSDNHQACIDIAEQALTEAGEAAGLCAAINADLAYFVILLGGDLTRAAAHAARAAELAEGAGDDQLLARALTMTAILEQGVGRPVPLETMERAIALEEPTGPLATQPGASAWLGQMLMWRGDLDAARPRLEAELERTTAIGDELPRSNALRLLSELELQAGNWELARRYAVEGETLMRLAGNERDQSVFLPAIALVDAHLGAVDAARSLAARGLVLAQQVGQRSAQARNLAVLGFVELSLGDGEAAHVHLGPAAELLLEMGVKVFTPFTGLHNAIEALIAVNELEQAERLVSELESYGREGGSAWAQGVGARGRGLLSIAHGHLDEGIAALGDAADGPPADPFERARTLLALGTALRQSKQKRASRETLQRALDAFDALGAVLWSAKAQAELRRIGGRLSYDGELSETERQIAELVASGRSNLEVAETLRLSPKTVEWNLSKIYRKLGVRGRAALAARQAAVKVD